METATDLAQLFARALPKERGQLEGAAVFKRAAVGLFSQSTVKTGSELADLLYRTGIAATEEEAASLVPRLDGQAIPYRSIFGEAAMIFERASGIPEKYKILIGHKWVADLVRTWAEHYCFNHK